MKMKQNDKQALKGGFAKQTKQINNRYQQTTLTNTKFSINFLSFLSFFLYFMLIAFCCCIVE